MSKKKLDDKGDLSEKVKERVEKAKQAAVKAVTEAEKLLKNIAGFEMTPAGQQANKDTGIRMAGVVSKPPSLFLCVDIVRCGKKCEK